MELVEIMDEIEKKYDVPLVRTAQTRCTLLYLVVSALEERTRSRRSGTMKVMPVTYYDENA